MLTAWVKDKRKKNFFLLKKELFLKTHSIFFSSGLFFFVSVHTQFFIFSRKQNPMESVGSYLFDDKKEVLEPRLTIADDSRYCLYPIRHQTMYDMWQTQIAMFWTPNEINFSEDYAKWKKMSADEQHYFAVVLAFFANADNIVMQNLSERFRSEITVPEARMFFAAQEFIESIHIDTYNRCIAAVIPDHNERLALFEAIKHNPIIIPKTQWMKQWIESDAPLSQRAFAWTLVEGVFFASSFLAMFWARKRSLFPGICFANEKIAEDEGLHVRFSVLLYEECQQKLNRSTIESMVRSAVDLEKKFGAEALRVDLLGMNITQMNRYVEFVADTILIMIGERPMYNVKNPFEWMIGLSIVGKSNFFEKRVAEYTRATYNEIHIENTGDEFDF